MPRKRSVIRLNIQLKIFRQPILLQKRQTIPRIKIILMLRRLLRLRLNIKLTRKPYLLFMINGLLIP